MAEPEPLEPLELALVAPWKVARSGWEMESEVGVSELPTETPTKTVKEYGIIDILYIIFYS